jgi:gamma-glutamyl-gamma-aminobutyrate hydrolase PuuD
MRPVIGITTRHADPAWIARNTQRYVDAVHMAGGEPLVIAPETHTAAVIDELAGLLLSGGGDIDPHVYGVQLDGSEEIDPARDELEIALTRAALERDLPVLGICRGFQVLNVVFGGQLVQDLPGHRGEMISPVMRADVPHPVDLTPGSRVATLLSETRIVVNSYHHQAVTPQCVGAGLVIAGRHAGADGIVEALEAPAYRWVLAVQWHPERYTTDAFSAPEAQLRLFEDFVRAAAKR